MRTSDTLTKIAPALVAALSKIEGAAKKKANPAFKTKYANLEAVIDASRDTLAEHGLTLIQLPGQLAAGVLTLETVLLHESGEFISGEFGIALGKVDPQGVGSALTYARRYAQMAALNMPAVDDDAEAAMGRAAPPTRHLTDEQITHVKHLMAEVGADPAAFLTFMKAKTFEELDFDRAVSALERKRKAAAE